MKLGADKHADSVHYRRDRSLNPILLPFMIVFFLLTAVAIAVLITVAAVAYLLAVGGAALWGLVRPRPGGLSRRETVGATVQVINKVALKSRRGRHARPRLLPRSLVPFTR
ncbi:hypothetical protein [Kutzneria kofuensis]|uniref:Uncharacterized protein n=1 Tax=Kutzneria kofuensis TaxID=103725 RepID=A0A7W9NGS2_9PSEU|nr:hypothetical protein [Kutzneria kofuensis]MBB5891849.1 hypothetical protein [Kutzneria kofuensis]